MRQTVALISRHIKNSRKVFNISTISKDTGLARPSVRNILKKHFPEDYIKSTYQKNQIEVSLELDENPEETIKFYKDLKYKYMGEVKTPLEKILIFVYRRAGWPPIDRYANIFVVS